MDYVVVMGEKHAQIEVLLPAKASMRDFFWPF